MLARSRTHQLNAAASRGKGHWPQAVRPPPGGRRIERGQKDIVAKLFVYLRRQSKTPLRYATM
jgi:hypothetical protein